MEKAELQSDFSVSELIHWICDFTRIPKNKYFDITSINSESEWYQAMYVADELIDSLVYSDEVEDYILELRQLIEDWENAQPSQPIIRPPGPNVLDYFPGFYFWDTYPILLNLQEHAVYIVEKVIMYCDHKSECLTNIEKLELIYPKEFILEVAIGSPELRRFSSARYRVYKMYGRTELIPEELRHLF